MTSGVNHVDTNDVSVQIEGEAPLSLESERRLEAGIRDAVAGRLRRFDPGGEAGEASGGEIGADLETDPGVDRRSRFWRSDRPAGPAGPAGIGGSLPSWETWAQVVELLNERERSLNFLTEGIAQFRDDGNFGEPSAGLRQAIEGLLARARRVSSRQSPMGRRPLGE
jgi:hypothetical protein